MTLHSLTKAEQPSENVIPYEQLNNTQQAVVDFHALGGVIIDPEDEKEPIKRRTITWLAEQLGVTRQALYDSKNSIPNFWHMVSLRRQLLAGQMRLDKVHTAWFLKAAKGEWQHLNAYLLNFDPNYVPPTQKVQHDLGKGLADLVQVVRKRQQADRPAPVEGEIVDATPGQPNQLSN